MGFPQFVVFNTLVDDKYLCANRQDSRLKFRAVDFDHWGVKHELVKERRVSTKEPVYHIRCCATGKYWTWKRSSRGRKAYFVRQAAHKKVINSRKHSTLVHIFPNNAKDVSIVNLGLAFEGRLRTMRRNLKGFVQRGPVRNVRKGIVGGDIIMIDWDSFLGSSDDNDSYDDEENDNDDNYDDYNDGFEDEDEDSNDDNDSIDEEEEECWGASLK